MNIRVDDLPSLSSVDSNSALYISQNGIPYQTPAINFITGLISGNFATVGQLNNVIVFITTGFITPTQLNTSSGVIITFTTTGFINPTQLNNAINFSQTGINSPHNYIGSGSPEGFIAALSGSIYTDWFNQTQYNKITGSGINGWV